MVVCKQTNKYVTAALVLGMGMALGFSAEAKTAKHKKQAWAPQAATVTPYDRAALDRACQTAKNAQACLQLGDLATTWQKPSRARVYYDLGCEHGNYIACVKSADGYAKAKLGEESRKDLTKACKIAGTESCADWGLKLVREKRYAEAPRFLDMGCNGGNEQACFALATINVANGDKAGRQVASTTFEKSCKDDNDGWSCAAIGKMEEAKGNAYRAKKLYGQACELNSPRGCLYLSQIHARNKDFDDSRDAAKRACELGDKNGCTVLRRFTNFEGSTAKLRTEAHNQCQDGDRAACNLMTAYTGNGMQGKAKKSRGLASVAEE